MFHLAAAVDGRSIIIVHDLFKVNGRHYAVCFRIHIGPRNLIDIEDRHVKGVRWIFPIAFFVELAQDAATDFIVLVLQ